MNSVVIQGVLNFIEIAVSLFLADQVFRNETKFRRMPFLLLFSAAGALVLTVREQNYSWILDYLPEIVIVFLYGLIVCRAAWWKSLLLALGNALMIGLMSVGIASLLGKVGPGTTLLYMREPYYLWVVAEVIIRVSQMFCSLVIVLLIRKAEKSGRPGRDEPFLIVLFGISIFALFCWLRQELIYTGMLRSYYDGIISLAIAAVNLFVLFISRKLEETRRKNEDLRVENAVMAMQVKSQAAVAESYSELRSLKHDMTGHLYAIEGYLQNNEPRKAQDYVSALLGQIREIVQYQTGSSTLDILIGSKESAARRNHIRVSTDVRLSSRLRISDEDLVVLVSNLYDNAIEACLRIPDESVRFIDIRILTEKGNAIFLFRNSAPRNSAAAQNGKWETVKSDTGAHGYGLKNIDRVVEKHEGYCERTQDRNGCFTCVIRIKNSPADAQQTPGGGE